MSLEVVALVPSRGPLRAMRGALITAGRPFLASAGLLEPYRARVSVELDRQLRPVAASDWVSVDLLAPHFAALDTLPMTPQARMALGATVGESNWGPTLRTVARLAGALGASPWLGIGRSPKFFERNLQGGGLRVSRRDRCVALVEMLDCGAWAAASDHFVYTTLGSWLAGVAAFAEPNRDADAIPLKRSPGRIAFELSWSERTRR
ncbi:MAG: hypothetical protein AAGH15_06680 [Myxococcota bacterium]